MKNSFIISFFFLLDQKDEACGLHVCAREREKVGGWMTLVVFSNFMSLFGDENCMISVRTLISVKLHACREWSCLYAFHHQVWYSCRCVILILAMEDALLLSPPTWVLLLCSLGSLFAPKCVFASD